MRRHSRENTTAVISPDATRLVFLTRGSLGRAQLAQQCRYVGASGVSHSSDPDSHKRVELNNRESDVLRFLVQELTNNQIARRMEISGDTVKHTVQHLFAKTNVRTRVLLVRVAIEHYRDLL